MPTRDPDELRARAAQLLEESIAAAERGDVAKADELILIAKTFIRASELAAELKAGSHGATMQPMQPATRAVSRSIARTETDHPFIRAMHAAGHTVRSLALEAGFSHQMLQKALSGERNLSPEKIARVEKIVGASWKTGK